MADVNTIHSAMLEALDPSYQKSPGFPAFDFTRAFALGLASLSSDIEAAEARLDPENLTGYDLDAYVWQHRAVERRQATCASGTLRVTTGAGHISRGDLFATAAGVQFMAEEDADVTAGSTFAAAAAEPGSAGNAAAGTVIAMPVTIQGIGGIVNDAAFAGGYDEESDEELRERYYEVLQRPANGGNIYAYEQWARTVEGVGRVTVIPTPRGPNTVDVYLVDSNGAPASDTLAAEVQQLLDPNHNGDGMGEAPIGAVCTVAAATPKVLDFSMAVTAPGDPSAEIEAALDQLVRKTALAGTSLRYADVVAAILVEGVEDYSIIRINGMTGTITFGATEAPVLGEVTVNHNPDPEESE